MADDGKTRVQRHRRHRAGDHSLCRPSHCAAAGRVETAGVHDLRAAVEAEFAADPVRLQTGRALVELAAGRGQPAVSALVALDRMVEASRAGRSAPVGGPVTIDDEIRELIDEVVDLGVAERLTELAGRQWLGPGGRPVPALIDELLVEIRGVR
jgi:predicted RNA polymerase sigma factor